MTDDRIRRRRQISIDGAGIERRKAAIQTIVDQAPPQPRPHTETPPLVSPAAQGTERTSPS
ncbi:hypothetical protein GCM10009733_086050 [Nonomuraea maheshkhaliensis]|uniref:Uncharacterized protein n=1 Tax=Nonomuraea maheshkhaliensis TaxID=419590 RepID=A0ABN2GRW4_9ACTN